MNRRDFLRAAGVAGGGTLLLGAYCGQNLYARYELEEQLFGAADPLLTHKALRELRDLPAQGREEIRIWFHGPCLNSALFASVVTSESFQERLSRCENRDEQHDQFLIEFESHVVSEAKIRNRVDVIAEELGSTLNLNWQECSQTLSDQWNVHIRNYGTTMPEDFVATLEPTIRAGIEKSLEIARGAGQRPALSHATGDLGKSALLLIPLARVPAAAPLFLPVFVVVSVGKLFSYFMGLWNQDRSVDVIRKSVSARLALLANRIADEFETEMRIAISRLHEWQQQAVAMAVRSRAKKTVPLL